MRTPVSCDSLIRREIEDLQNKVFRESRETRELRELRELRKLAESIVKERGL